MINYEQARAYLARPEFQISRPGLKSMTELMHEMGDPQDELSFVHISGTNGKGSVMAMLDQILIRAGYKTGRYLSPAVFAYEEKFRFCGQWISPEDLARMTEVVAAAVERMRSRGSVLPTVFELETALAFAYFRDQGCDLCLVEVGMGGAEDATNIIRHTRVAILSSISVDHARYLGDTPAKIAAVKAGIIKPGAAVVSAAQEEAVQEVFRQESRRLGCRLTFAEKDELTVLEEGPDGIRFNCGAWEKLQMPVCGAWQPANAQLALMAVRALREKGCEISDDAVRQGLANVRIPGRFEIRRRHPYVVTDGAHNPDAAVKLMHSVDRVFAGRRIWYIFGVFSDKEYDKIIQITASRAAGIFTVPTSVPGRAVTSEDLAEAVRPVNAQVIPCADMQEAVARAAEAAREEDVILIFGSLSILAGAAQAIDRSWPETTSI